MVLDNYVQETNDFFKCPECKNDLIYYRHEKVCENCGLIINETKFVESYQFNEIKNSDLSSGDQFVSLGKTIDNVCTLGSHIDYYSSNTFYDINHNILASDSQKLYRKLKKFYSLPLKIKNHETDYRILNILTKICQYMDLSSQIKARAAYFYVSIKKRASSITNHVSLIGFCIFFASRENSHRSPISIKEICNVFNLMGHRIRPKLIIRDSIEYKHFIQNNENPNTPHRSEDFIIRFLNDIELSNSIFSRMEKKGSNLSKKEYICEMEKMCHYILKQLNKNIRSSRNPFILAGAIVYCADKLVAKKMKSKPVLTQKLASEAMKIADYSIRDHYVKVLKPFFKL